MTLLTAHPEVSKDERRMTLRATFYVYMVQCSDDSIYVGQTDNLEARLVAHQTGAFKGYTFKRRPVRLIFCEEFSTREEAFASERRIKGWSHAKKLALARGDWAEVIRLARM